MAPRFLASAFAAGPSLLILLCLLVRHNTKFDPGKEQIQTLAKIVTYAILVNIFLFFCEVFTVFYSSIPEHTMHFKYLFLGLEGKHQLVPFMWFSMVGMITAALLMVNPKVRANETTLAYCCALIIITTYIDKGLGLIQRASFPTPWSISPNTGPPGLEAMITLGIWAAGFFVLALLFKIAVSIKEEVRA